jgi:hypothetical protein
MKRFLLWDYPRAVWQYDVMVVAILAFMFLTPREIFRDQPRASNIAILHPDNGTNVFWIEPELLSSIPESQRNSRVEALLKARFGKKESVVRLQPIFDAEDAVKGYMAYTRTQ